MPTKNTFRAAALLSCIAAVAAVLARVFGVAGHAHEVTTAQVTTALGAVGLLTAGAAIVGIPKHGSDGIIVPAIIGLLCGIWMFWTSVLVLMNP